MRLYFDTCCYNRPYDKQLQERIRKESVAVQNIIKLAHWRGDVVLGSTTLEKEIGDIATVRPKKHRLVSELYRRTVAYKSRYNKDIFNRFMPLALQAGIDGSDAMHLCHAIAADADYLLTTDDVFLKIASRLDIPVKVINPLHFSLGGL